MKGQVLPEELQCLGTERDCGCGVNMDDRTVKMERGETESKSEKLTVLSPLSKVVYLSKHVFKTSVRKPLYFIFQSFLHNQWVIML